MKKFSFGIFLIIYIFLSFTQIVSADLINPEYYRKTCNPGEVLVECNYKSSEPFGPKTYDECEKYQDNPNFRYLVGEGSSFSGRQKFCFKAISASNFIGFHIKTLMPLLLITLLLEIPIFLLIISKTRKALSAVLFANLISVPLLYVVTVFLPFSGFLIVLILELTVIIFEAVFIKSMLQSVKFARILLYSFVANAVSAILGNLILILSTLVKMMYF